MAGTLAKFSPRSAPALLGRAYNRAQGRRNRSAKGAASVTDDAEYGDLVLELSDAGWNVGPIMPRAGGGDVAVTLFPAPHTTYFPGIESDMAYGNDPKDAIRNYLSLLKEKRDADGP